MPSHNIPDIQIQPMIDSTFSKIDGNSCLPHNESRCPQYHSNIIFSASVWNREEGREKLEKRQRKKLRGGCVSCSRRESWCIIRRKNEISLSVSVFRKIRGSARARKSKFDLRTYGIRFFIHIYPKITFLLKLRRIFFSLFEKLALV
jgi:hypothetical protein